MSKSTEELIQEYSAAKAAYGNASTVLLQRAVEESGFKVGDIIKEVSTDPKYKPREQPECIISRLIGKVNEYDGIRLETKGATRKRLKSGGWHAIENDQYSLNSKPLYAGGFYWKIIGHEDLENTSK